MGKKKGKGAKNKLARMSDEERARYLQHRADIEEEARRRKQQLIAIYMKNKLKREEAFSRLNTVKINEEWRSILRQLKCQELRNEIKLMQTIFEETLESKCKKITRLLCDLDKSEDNYATLLHGHINSIHKLMDINVARHAFWRDWYEKQKEIIVCKFVKDIQKANKHNTYVTEYMEGSIAALNSEVQEKLNITDDKYAKTLDDVNSTHILRSEELIKSGEHKMEVNWKKFQKVLTAYASQTQEFHNAYVECRQRDRCDSQTIQNHYILVSTLVEDINKLKAHLVSARDSHTLSFKCLNQLKTTLQERYGGIKKQFELSIAVDRKNLRYMVVCSSNKTNELSKILKIGQRILEIGAMCRKYETAKELIVVDDKTEGDETDSGTTDRPAFFKMSGSIHMFSELENFFGRQSRVRNNLINLKAEKQFLLKENRELKDTLRNYLTMVTVAKPEIYQNVVQFRPSSMQVDKIGQPTLTTDKRRQRPLTTFVTSSVAKKTL